MDYEPQSDDDEESVLLLEDLRDEINRILHLVADNPLLVEKIGSKVSETTAATITRNKRRKVTTQEDALLERYFAEVIPKISTVNLNSSPCYIMKALPFFHRHTAHIDVLKEDELFKTYFMILPHCTHITQSLQDAFHQKIDRQSVKSKVSSLVEKSNEIIETLKHEER